MIPSNWLLSNLIVFKSAFRCHFPSSGISPEKEFFETDKIFQFVLFAISVGSVPPKPQLEACRVFRRGAFEKNSDVRFPMKALLAIERDFKLEFAPAPVPTFEGKVSLIMLFETSRDSSFVHLNIFSSRPVNLQDVTEILFKNEEVRKASDTDGKVPPMAQFWIVSEVIFGESMRDCGTSPVMEVTMALKVCKFGGHFEGRDPVTGT